MQENKSTMLLEKCRQMMTKRMRFAITEMLNEVDEKLMAMAQASSGNSNASACYEAIREIRLKRGEIKTRFERRFINLFDNELKTINQSDKTIPAGYRNILRSRVEVKPDSRLNLPLQESLGAMNQNFGKVLMELDRKISLLLDVPGHVNPMQPAIIFEAFNEACWDIKSGDEVRLMMFTIFEQRIAQELNDIYSDVNTILGENKHDRLEQTVPVQNGTDEPQDRETVLLRYEVINRIESRLGGHDVPDFIRAFLLKRWRVFLEHVYREYSENSIAWNAARQTMDDLIWIASIPGTHYARERQVQLLPSLLFRLLNGMKVISMKDGEIDEFLKQLREHQLKSLNAEDEGLLDTITEEARNSISKSHSKLTH